MRPGMLKRITQLASVAVISLSAATAPTTAANAETDTGADGAQTGCVMAGAGWGASGSFVNIFIYDSVTWHSASRMTIGQSTSRGRLLNCATGGLQSGGEKKLTTSYRVEGQGITSCNIGLSGCTYSDTTPAVSNYNTGWNSNSNGQYLVETTGEVYARTGHRLTDYTHEATASFRKNGSAFNVGRATHFVNNA